MSAPMPLPMTDDLHHSHWHPDERGFGALQTEAGVLPLQAMQVRAKVTALAYEMSIEQTFANAYETALEATYIFPLPSRAAVSRFVLKVGERIIEGVLKERGAARREYQQAIEQGHRAALAEEDRPDLFSMKVGNIPQGESARVELTLCGQLPLVDGEAELRFPLVVAPRYIPGRALAGEPVGDGVATDTDRTPDASRISPPTLLPGYPNPVRLNIEVEIDPAGLGMHDLRSSLHAVQEQQVGDNTLIRLYPGERLNRDFVLRFRLGSAVLATSATVVTDNDSKEATFMATLTPPVGLGLEQRPRDVVFLLDRSGSMEGWKMVAARRAIGRMVDSLCDRDRLSVLLFDTDLEALPHKAMQSLQVARDRTRFAVVEKLGNAQARGGTEIDMALEHGLALFDASDSERERILVLVTDGQVGNEDEIIRRHGSKIERVRMFTLGIDRAVNEGFLRRLASMGGGHCELVESEDRLDEVMDRIQRLIGTPALTDLQVDVIDGELLSESLVPYRLPDVFAGVPAMVLGRCQGNSAALHLSGKTADGSAWQQRIPLSTTSQQAITKLWARGRIRDLEDQYQKGRDKKRIEKEILQTSLRHTVLCRFSAFVAVDNSEVVNPGGRTQQQTQPVETPEGWEMAHALAMPAPQMRSRFAAMAPPPPPQPASAPVLSTAMLQTQFEVEFSEESESMRGGDFMSRQEAPLVAPLASKRVLSRRSVGLEEEAADILRQVSEYDVVKKAKPRLSHAVDVVRDALHMRTTKPTLSAAEKARALLLQMQELVQRGTDVLSQLLWSLRDDLRTLAKDLAASPATVQHSIVLSKLVDDLDSFKRCPDSALTVRVWQKLEPLLVEISGEIDSATERGGFWR